MPTLARAADGVPPHGATTSHPGVAARAPLPNIPHSAAGLAAPVLRWRGRALEAPLVAAAALWCTSLAVGVWGQSQFGASDPAVGSAAYAVAALLALVAGHLVSAPLPPWRAAATRVPALVSLIRRPVIGLGALAGVGCVAAVYLVATASPDAPPGKLYDPTTAQGSRSGAG